MYHRTCTALAAFLLLALGVQSQITVSEYPMQLRSDINALDQIAAPQATSECGAVDVAVDDQIFSGGCLGTLVRTYTFSDGCGNIERAQQYITLEDSTPPVFDNLPSNITAAENAIPESPEVSASDNSEFDVRVSMKETREGNTITRVWTAIDQCGNTTIGTQVITIEK